MTPICTFIIPTRGRVPRLRDAIKSIRESADPSDYEIILRMDFDDAPTQAFAVEAMEFWNCKIVHGNRLKGYSSMELFFRELSDQSTTPWIWNFNDDSMIYGKWADQLRAVATTGFICQPETYQLNQSRYLNCEGGAFPCVPNKSWKLFGVESIPNPIDIALDQILRLEGKWKTHFLKGVRIFHDRHESPDFDQMEPMI